MRLIYLFIFVFGLLAGCSANTPEKNPEQAAKIIFQTMDNEDWGTLWDYVSFESRGDLSEQLNTVRLNFPQVFDMYKIPKEEAKTITPKEYFKYLMEDSARKARAVNPDPFHTQILGVEKVEEGTAKVFWKSNIAEGVERLIKENGGWKLIVEVNK